ncbi:hypothetical protein [Microvirga thermotolerans]|uniref:DUF3185 family protein n=1 Tax=Microvirga thermotolerans TaxID=2651334 RepID=A0A5P9JW57_9HYPH|nr:hypothetical protein [Microvirga thermotolerans]QFU17042.1 hypothetical protein GDR74_12875 [Microvirga thermotolerans]
MRITYIILGLLVFGAVLTMLISQDPQKSASLSQMYRDAAFSGETREIVLALLAFGIGGFIVYLTMTRR